LLSWLPGWDTRKTYKEVSKVLGLDDSGEPIALPERKVLPLDTERETQKEAERRTRVSSQIDRLLGESLYLSVDTLGDPARHREMIAPALRYFQNRGIQLKDFGLLKLHPSLGYYDPDRGHLGHFPCLLAPILSPSGAIVGLHRTYLAEDGKKAPVPQPKKILGSKGDGGAVCLFGHCYDRELGVTEGIETALAVRADYIQSGKGIAVWSLVDAHNMRKFNPERWRRFLDPDGVFPPIERVLIFGDRDQSGTGQRAADDLKRSLESKGLEAVTLLPPSGDWNDYTTTSLDVREAV
jgi:hypothetical protein